MNQTLRATCRPLASGFLGLALLLGSPQPPALAQTTPAGNAPPQPATAVAVSEEPGGFLAEPRLITRVVDLANRFTDDETAPPKNGFYPEWGYMPTGSGWISVGPGYRHWLLGGNAFVDGSATISWRAYKLAQARFELPRMGDNRLLLGTQVLWQDFTQMAYYGEGPDASVNDESEYRLKSTMAVAYATMRISDQTSAVYRGGWIGGLSVQPPSGAFLRHNPASQDLFPDNPSFNRDQPNFAYGDVALMYDSRDFRSHPAAGGVYRLAWSGFSDRGAGLYTFQRAEIEGAHFVAMGTPKAVLAVHGWVVDSVPANGNLVPSYMEPTLGGSNTLRSYANYRFHDRDMLVLNVETRFALFTHVDAALFADAGNVAPKVNDLNLDKRSYGAGLRVHTRRATFGRMDVAYGSDGWQVLFHMDDAIHLSRLYDRTPQVPFVP